MCIHSESYENHKPPPQGSVDSNKALQKVFGKHNCLFIIKFVSSHKLIKVKQSTSLDNSFPVSRTDE